MYYVFHWTVTHILSINTPVYAIFISVSSKKKKKKKIHRTRPTEKEKEKEINRIHTLVGENTRRNPISSSKYNPARNNTLSPRNLRIVHSTRTTAQSCDLPTTLPAPFRTRTIPLKLGRYNVHRQREERRERYRDRGIVAKKGRGRRKEGRRVGGIVEN